MFHRKRPNRWSNWSSPTDGETWLETFYRVDPRVAGLPRFAVPYQSPGGVWDEDMRRLWPTWPYPDPLTDDQAERILDLVRRRHELDPSRASLPPVGAILCEGLWCAFSRTGLHSAWLTKEAVSVAREIRGGQAEDLMPVLGDALRDAGCEADQLLAHCDGPGPHARWC